MDEIYLKIISTIRKHSSDRGGIVCELGDRGIYPRYAYIDVGLGKRQSIDNAKRLFMNECMDILIQLQILLESPTDTPCSSFVCQPGCSCGTWGQEPYVQEENYMSEDEIETQFYDELQ